MRMLNKTSRPPSRGLSIVEMMVGVAVGLVIVAIALKVLADYVTANRRVLLEARVSQDLRTGADLIARDLRRAGYWRNAASSIWAPDAATPLIAGSFTLNPYREIRYSLSGAVADLSTCPTGGPSQKTLTYFYAKDADDAPDTVGSGESLGFREGTDGSLEMCNGGNWQKVTDPSVLRISLNIASAPSSALPVVELYEGCACFTRGLCPASRFQVGGSNYGTRPRASVAEFMVSLSASSVSDSRVVRSLSETVRIRNDFVTGTCPAT